MGMEIAMEIPDFPSVRVWDGYGDFYGDFCIDVTLSANDLNMG